MCSFILTEGESNFIFTASGFGGSFKQRHYCGLFEGGNLTAHSFSTSACQIVFYKYFCGTVGEREPAYP